ncbi:hypothetical protein WN51_07039 [Melipona quadrifasciata]|uniref:Uncharacterized protein n=1 Tax=Melipona quadrifasciata TaxID=166423 RepID=A0A0N0U348_9HYME|nr:hypothetical protein WN51_07039 [Melipona quadrifasciata]
MVEGTKRESKRGKSKVGKEKEASARGCWTGEGGERRRRRRRIAWYTGKAGRVEVTGSMEQKGDGGGGGGSGGSADIVEVGGDGRRGAAPEQRETVKRHKRGGGGDGGGSGGGGGGGGGGGVDGGAARRGGKRGAGNREPNQPTRISFVGNALLIGSYAFVDRYLTWTDRTGSIDRPTDRSSRHDRPLAAFARPSARSNSWRFEATGPKRQEWKQKQKQKLKQKLKPLASTRGHGAQRVRSTVTLDLAGREKGELSQRDYTNPSSTGALQLR